MEHTYPPEIQTTQTDASTLSSCMPEPILQNGLCGLFILVGFFIKFSLSYLGLRMKAKSNGEKF